MLRLTAGQGVTFPLASLKTLKSFIFKAFPVGLQMVSYLLPFPLFQ